jgi:gliding motility-associated-like protein
VGSITYYAETFDPNTGCISATRTPAVLTIDPTPVAPTTIDITECDTGQTITATATADPAQTITWYDAATAGNIVNNPSLTGMGTATYYAETFDPTTGCVSTRSAIVLTIGSIPVAPTTSDITECDTGQTITATATADPAQTITWYDAATAGSIVSDPSLTGVGTATYYAEASDPNTGCVSATRSSLTLILSPFPYVEFDDNYLICNGISGTISNNVFVDSGLSASIYSFLWIDQLGTLISTDPILTTDVPGTYSLIVTDTNTNCSFQSETFSVNESSFPVLVAEVSSATFADTHVIDATVTGTGIYEFSIDNGPWQADGNFTGVSPGEHIVRVRDVNGCGEDFIDLIVLDFPRFFTPNGDGYNDLWNINTLSGQPASKIYIFDRYGKLLKMIKPSGFGWDGTYNGNRMPTADYWFLLEYYDLTSGAPKQFRGHFTLKR